MLDALKFVKGAVSTKDFVPALTHFRIANGRVTGFNGKLSLSAPIALDVDCCPKADAFVKAIMACDETAQLHLTPSRKLAIRSGKFRAHVDTLDEAEFPVVQPEGLVVPLHEGMVETFGYLYDFIAEDASKPWATGLLLDGQSAFATNNVCLVQAWLGDHFPYRVVIPRFAVKELLRVEEDPVSVQLTQNSATFHYADGRWLRTQLIDSPWPDIGAVFDAMPSTVQPKPKELVEALETLAPFTDDMNHVYVMGNVLATAKEDGASVELKGKPPGDGAYNLKMLAMVARVATHIGFSMFPEPVAFYSQTLKLRGVIAGMRT